ncbi:MAG: diguanylate cyclase [Marinobacter sp.]
MVALSDIFDVIPLESFVTTTIVLSMCAYVFAIQGVKQLRLLKTLNTIGAALSNAERSHVQQALVMLDLDFFKVMNDKCGHVIGDKVLKMCFDDSPQPAQPRKNPSLSVTAALCCSAPLDNSLIGSC